MSSQDSSQVPEIGRAYRAVAALPLEPRRRLTRALYALWALPARLRADPRQSGYGELYRKVLRVSRHEAGRLDHETGLHDLAAEIEWLSLSRRSIPAVRRDMGRIRIEGEDLIERVAASGRPVILAPLHMGAYVIGLGHTMLRHFAGRRLLILRQREDQAMETGVMERMREVGMDLRFLQVERRSDFLSAVRFARQGAVIVLFCDLPPAYGSPAPMPMFGLDTHFAFGIDAFARLTDAMVVPWSSVMNPDGDVIRIGRPFEAQGDTPEDRARMAGLIRDHIRDALRARPEQWHLWSTLDEYLPGARTMPPETAEESSALREVA